MTVADWGLLMAAATAAGWVDAVVGGGGLSIGTRGTSLHVARLAPEMSVVLPDAARQHAFVAIGAGRIDDQVLGPGDAVRLTDRPGAKFEATAEVELLVWSFRS